MCGNRFRQQYGGDMDIVKISLLGIGGVILGFLIKNTKPEYACLLTLGVGVTILSLAVGKIVYLFEVIADIRKQLPMDSKYLTILLKMTGITYIGQFSAAICKDAGYQTIGSQIELFCKLSIMVLSIPILQALLQTIQELLV